MERDRVHSRVPPVVAAHARDYAVERRRQPCLSRPSRGVPSATVNTPLLQAVSITKSFSGVCALRGVSFDLRHGEVHALVGENGAGKSTLIKIITGAVAPDSGSLSVSGRAVPHMLPALSRALGIAAIYQQPALFPHLTVAENIALARERAPDWRRVDWKRRRRQAIDVLERVGAPI